MATLICMKAQFQRRTHRLRAVVVMIAALSASASLSVGAKTYAESRAEDLSTTVEAYVKAGNELAGNFIEAGRRGDRDWGCDSAQSAKHAYEQAVETLDEMITLFQQHWPDSVGQLRAQREAGVGRVDDMDSAINAACYGW